MKKSFVIKDNEQVNGDIKVEIDTNHACGYTDPVVVLEFEHRLECLILTLDEMKDLIRKIEKTVRKVEKREIKKEIEK